MKVYELGFAVVTTKRMSQWLNVIRVFFFLLMYITVQVQWFSQGNFFHLVTSAAGPFHFVAEPFEHVAFMGTSK